MNKKDRTIKAIEYLIVEYKAHNYIPYITNCPLCILHRRHPFPKSCKGCPQACIEGGIGCILFDSYPKSPSSPTYQVAQDIRAAFHERLLKKIKRLPPSRFTIRGWKYLKMKYDQ
ncbi:hypothetical protein LCGC14_0245850 [marine sediment metagenome]|uniref:Uncharacterized protein n=1 Tax=marine sediment metagenome TaxID=412755 RepID=A0A0F9UAK8_9ZZZZ